MDRFGADCVTGWALAGGVLKFQSTDVESRKNRTTTGSDLECLFCTFLLDHITYV